MKPVESSSQPKPDDVKAKTDSGNGKKGGEETTAKPPPAPDELPKPPKEPNPTPPEKTTQPDTQPPPQAAPQPEPPSTDALKDLATSVDLPELSNGQKTASLGKVLLSPGMSLQLVLIGGDKAVKPSDSIIMIPVRQSPLWQVYVETASKENGDPTGQIEIAQLRIVAGNLLFNWMPNATSAYAEALKNCGILAFAQGQQQFVQLCRPRQAEPLVLDLDNGVAKVTLPIGSLPESGSLRVQITDRDAAAFPPMPCNPATLSK